MIKMTFFGSKTDVVKGYAFIKKIGSGGFGEVFQAVHQFSGKHYAVKVIHKRRISSDSLRRRVRAEAEIHCQLKHPTILEIFEVFENAECIFLVLELCQHGDLHTYLKTHRLREQEARVIFLQVLEGLSYLHSHGIMHRDINCNNILLTSQMEVKICDFGMATISGPQEHRMTTICGTPNAIAPEMLGNSGYSMSADVWSLGVLLYRLIVGEHPFDGTSVKDTFRNIRNAAPKDYPSWVSLEARELISMLLCKDEALRPSLDQIKLHRFLHPANTQFSQMNKRPVIQGTIDSGLGSVLSSSRFHNEQNLHHNYQGSLLPSSQPIIREVTNHSQVYQQQYSQIDFRHHHQQQQESYHTNLVPQATQSRTCSCSTHSYSHPNKENQLTRCVGCSGVQCNSNSYLPSQHPSVNYTAKATNSGFVSNQNIEGHTAAPLKSTSHAHNYDSMPRTPAQLHARAPAEATPDSAGYFSSGSASVTDIQRPYRSLASQALLEGQRSSTNLSALRRTQLSSASPELQISHLNSRLVSSHERSERSPGNTDIPPLDTTRLRPFRQKLKDAIVYIESDGHVCAEFLKHRNGEELVFEMLRISEDGDQISIYQPKNGVKPNKETPLVIPEGKAKIYNLNSLPERYKRKYRYAARFVSLVKSKSPKVTIYTGDAKVMLMEDTKHTEVDFYTGWKLSFGPSRSKMLTPSGDERFTDLGDLTASERDILSKGKEYIEHCKRLEQLGNISASPVCANFPMTVGRRPLANQSST